MERKLEQRDVTGYLPYDLKMYAGKIEGTELIYPVLGLQNDGRILTYVNGEDDSFGTAYFDVDGIRLILRPESDMYRTITHNGEEIIPIVELAKISMNCVVSGEWILDEDGEAINEECELAFGYNWAGGDFYCYSTRRAGDFYTPRFQHRLFDYLHELKIDYRGLINAGLAISVYDLDTNPYK